LPASTSNPITNDKSIIMNIGYALQDERYVHFNEQEK